MVRSPASSCRAGAASQDDPPAANQQRSPGAGDPQTKPFGGWFSHTPVAARNTRCESRQTLLQSARACASGLPAWKPWGNQVSPAAALALPSLPGRPLPCLIRLFHPQLRFAKLLRDLSTIEGLPLLPSRLPVFLRSDFCSELTHPPALAPSTTRKAGQGVRPHHGDDPIPVILPTSPASHSHTLPPVTCREVLPLRVPARLDVPRGTVERRR